MFENIRVNNPNFCIGPQTGTYCSVDSDNDPVVMHVRNDSGGLIRTYGFYEPGILETGPYEYEADTPLSSTGYFYNEFVTIKYIGPQDQDSYFNGAVFYTLERRANVYREFYTFERELDVEGHPYKLDPYDVNIKQEEIDTVEAYRPSPYEEYNLTTVSGYLLTDDRVEYSSNIIRRWVLDEANARLVLNRTVIRNSKGTDWFGGDAFAVLHTVSPMTDHTARGSGQIYISTTTTSGLKKYDTIMLGPSADQDNVGEIEEVYVHSIDGGTVVIKAYEGDTPPKYDYMEGDMVTTFGDILLFGNARPLINEKAIEYAVDRPKGTLFHLDQTNYGEVSHREYSGVYQDIQAAVWNVYMGTLSFVKSGNLLHMDIDDYEIARSQNLSLEYPVTNKLIVLYDLEVKDITIYRLQKEIVKKDDIGQYAKISWDTYNYHADSLLPYSCSIALKSDNNVLKVSNRANITATVRDQFGVGLINKNIWLTTEGDSGAVIQPVDGYGQSNSDGQSFLIYDSGYNTQAQIQIKAVVDGGNITHGTQFVNGVINLTQYNEFMADISLIGVYDIGGQGSIFTKGYLIPAQTKGAPIIQQVSVPACDGSIAIQEIVSFMYPLNRLIREYEWMYYEDTSYPCLIKTHGEPDLHPELMGLKPVTGYYPQAVELNLPIIRLLLCKLITEGDNQGDNVLGQSSMHLPLFHEGSSEHYISQNYISRHLLYGHTAVVPLDQYVFVQEATPAMWSEKNNVDTDYWIRLRPFASNLDPNTLVIKFREESYLGMSDWYEVTPFGTITMFDAGGGLLGIDFYYIPPIVFHHNAIVYVSIEVYDTSNIPNKILVDYWFKLIPDFKAPHLDNLFPSIEEPNAAINTLITFDCLDIGEGVDISTLEIFVNNRSTIFTYDEFEHGNYHITCDLPYVFYYGQTVNVVVDVKDRSVNANRLFDGWKFFITDSTTPWFNMDNTEPVRCVEGRGRDQNVSLQVYGVDDTGIEYDSLRLEVGGKYRNIKITPIVYRLS